MHSLATYAKHMVRPKKLFLIIIVYFAKEKNKHFIHSFIHYICVSKRYISRDGALNCFLQVFV